MNDLLGEIPECGGCHDKTTCVGILYQRAVDLQAALRALTAAPPTGAIPRKPYWLIERGQQEGQIPTIWVTGDDWRTGMPYLGKWTETAAKAMRFPLWSKGDEFAQANSIANYRVTGHLDLDAAPKVTEGARTKPCGPWGGSDYCGFCGASYCGIDPSKTCRWNKDGLPKPEDVIAFGCSAEAEHPSDGPCEQWCGNRTCPTTIAPPTEQKIWYGNPNSRGTKDEIADALAITKKIVAAEAEPTGAQADDDSAQIHTWRQAWRDVEAARLALLEKNGRLQRDLEAAKASEDAAIKSDTIAHEQIQELRAQLASAAAVLQAVRSCHVCKVCARRASAALSSDTP